MLRWAKIGLDRARVLAIVGELVAIEAVITALGRDEGDSLLGLPDNFVEIHRALIISL
jgi:hypothetical protein